MSLSNISVQRVDSLQSHPNADRLEIVSICGYNVVVQKGVIRQGQNGIFFPPDNLIPTRVAEILGVAKYLKHAVYPGDLEKSACRIGATRLRGVSSFGFVIPTELQEIGRDLNGIYEAVRYEPAPKLYQGDQLPEHPKFHRYTEIENVQRFPDTIPEGTPVAISEKLHGCVRSDTRITMADGTSKHITQIQVGDYVSGVRDGNVVPAEVLQTFNNGKYAKWLSIKFTRNKAGRGNSYGGLHCTPNHRFWVNDHYIEAERLQVGDAVTLLRADLSLSPSQHAVLLGKVLGDGSLCRQPCGSLSVSIGHTSQELLDWTARGLGGLLMPGPDHISGYGSVIHNAHTCTSHTISQEFGDFYTEKSALGAKCIPLRVADLLTPLSLAFWYMDDGSLGHSDDGSEDKANFAVCRYSKCDCEVLMQGLARFGITAKYYDTQGYSRLRLNADDAERFFLLVAPYIPPAMQYKLPARYRGHAGWLPEASKTYKPLLVTQIITSIEIDESPLSKCRYDIETDTHNYFANHVLVHNSNCRTGVIDGEFMVGSHRCQRVAGDNIYWRALEPCLTFLNDMKEDGHDVIVFGEIYGRGIQDLTYGETTPVFRCFDISVNGLYLSHYLTMMLCKSYSIPTVPILWVGAYSHEKLVSLTDGKSSLADHVREGVVVKALEETVPRQILKSVSVDYYARG